LGRAKRPFPAADICPSCWLDHGRRVRMVPQPSGRPRIDIFRCGNCGHIEEQRA
jgi:hypothetical protein